MNGVVVKVKLHVDRVQQRIAAKKRRCLFRQGGYLKTAMQRMMRYSNKPSEPGRPPHARKLNPLLRKLIAFSVDLMTGTVICGPKLFAGSKVNSSKPLPQLLDGGGDIELELKGRSVSAHIAPRPFRAPVFTDGGENFRKLLETERL